MLAPHSVLRNRFSVERLIEQRADSALYLGADQQSKRPVEIKAILRDAPGIAAQFERAAAALAQLRHPALPAVLDYAADEQTCYLVYEHVPGTDLNEYLARQGGHRLSDRAALDLLAPVIDALAAMHGRTPPLLHLNIQPTSIRITPGGPAVLANMGLVRAGGSPGFAPPEPATESGSRADVYALGAMLYYLLSGAVPPPAHERLAGALVAPLPAQITPALAASVTRMLVLSPAQRPADAAEIQRELFGASAEQMCPRCATSNRGNAKFCRKCGEPLPGLQPASASAAAPAPTAPLPPTDVLPIPSALRAPPTEHPAAAPNNRRALLIGLGAGGAVLLLMALCAVWLLLGLLNPGPGPLPTTTAAVAAEATAGQITPAASPTSRATAQALAEATATSRAQASATSAARQVARTATARAARQAATSAAIRTATAAVPTATPAPELLQPVPGTLSLNDYQTLVKQYRQVVFETFDRGRRTAGQWPEYDDANAAATLRGNIYAFTLKQPDLIRSATWSQQRMGPDYNVELAVAFETPGAPASVGIAFDIQDGERYNGVLFEIFNDQHWQLTTIEDGALVPERSTGRISEPALVGGNGTNLLWVVRQPEQVQLWINSKHVATVPASRFDGGYAGAVSSSYSQLSSPAVLITDNFRLRTR